MLKKLLSFYFLLFCASLPAAVNYNDVAVIVNTSSSVSVNVANYFQVQRSIPEKNMIRISMPTTEEIDGTQFATIYQQITDSMVARKIDTTINYIVTTKGVPLKICRNPLCNYNPPSAQYATSAAFDNELMLIKYKTGLIGSTSAQVSAYYTTNKHFSSKVEQMYLVTRLTGYNEQLIMTLIDNSGPDIAVGKNNTKFVLDGVATGVYSSTNPNLNLPALETLLMNRGWTVVRDAKDNTYLKNQATVIGAWTWGSNHQGQTQSSSKPNNFWAKGALVGMGVSLSGRTFDSSSAFFGVGQSLAAEWTAEGVAGINAYVYECYVSSYIDPLILFDRYTDTLNNYNLAESYYMSLYTTSWMGLIVGDPKTSIKPLAVGIPEKETGLLDLELFPNPAAEEVRIRFSTKTSGTFRIRLLDIAGKEIYQGAETELSTGHHEMELNVSGIPNGVYQLQLQGSQASAFRKLVLLK